MYNHHMAHGLAHTLDSLNGAVWFTTLHLKSGYMQVEMDEASKPLMTFTVGPLEFYKCNCMPLVNTPDTFQRLMRHVWVTFSSSVVSSISMTL